MTTPRAAQCAPGTFNSTGTGNEPCTPAPRGSSSTPRGRCLPLRVRWGGSRTRRVRRSVCSPLLERTSEAFRSDSRGPSARLVPTSLMPGQTECLLAPIGTYVDTYRGHDRHRLPGGHHDRGTRCHLGRRLRARQRRGRHHLGRSGRPDVRVPLMALAQMPSSPSRTEWSLTGQGTSPWPTQQTGRSARSHQRAA